MRESVSVSYKFKSKLSEREIWNGDYMGEAFFYTRKEFISLISKD